MIQSKIKTSMHSNLLDQTWKIYWKRYPHQTRVKLYMSIKFFSLMLLLKKSNIVMPIVRDTWCSIPTLFTPRFHLLPNSASENSLALLLIKIMKQPLQYSYLLLDVKDVLKIRSHLWEEFEFLWELVTFLQNFQ